MANTDMTRHDILLRIETLVGLNTKGSLLTNSELDKGLIGLYNDLCKLMDIYNEGDPIYNGGVSVADASKNNTYKTEVVNGEYVVSYSDDALSTSRPVLKMAADGSSMTFGADGAGQYRISKQPNGEVLMELSDGMAFNPVSLVSLPVLIPSLITPSVKFGYLYNIFTILDARKFTSSDDWSVFVATNLPAGANSNNDLIIEKGIIHWYTNPTATNIYNFNGRGNGIRKHDDGSYDLFKESLCLATADKTYAQITPAGTTISNISPLASFNRTGVGLRVQRAATVTEQTYPDGTPCTPYVGNDGQIYPAVKIGAFVFLACNLAETKFRDGSLISLLTDSSDWITTNTSARCFPNGEKQNVYYFIFNDYQPFQKTLNYEAPAADIDSGTATGGSDTELEDTAKSWTVDEHIGKVVEITPSDGTAPVCGLVLGNTADTLTFDDTLDSAVVATDTYRILNTVAIPDDSYIVAFDTLTNLNDCAAVLPRSTDLNERKRITTYIEMGNGHKVTIMAQGTDRTGGQKCYTLEAKRESVTALPHQWNSPHFDIVEQFNIQRIATWYWDTDTAVPATLDNLHVSPNITLDNARRFRIYNDGTYDWIEYTSQFEFLFVVRAFLIVAKTAGAGDMYIAVRHYISETDTTEDLTARLSASTFGAGTGTQQLSISVPVVLNRGDRIALIGDASSSTFTIKTGSHAEIK